MIEKLNFLWWRWGMKVSDSLCPPCPSLRTNGLAWGIKGVTSWPTTACYQSCWPTDKCEKKQWRGQEGSKSEVRDANFCREWSPLYEWWSARAPWLCVVWKSIVLQEDTKAATGTDRLTHNVTNATRPWDKADWKRKAKNARWTFESEGNGICVQCQASKAYFCFLYTGRPAWLGSH